MKLSLDLYSKEPMYAQIVSQLKEQIYVFSSTLFRKA